MDRRQKEILINLYKEHMKAEPNMLYQNMLKSISKLSGMGTKTIAKTISEYKCSGTVSSLYRKRIKRSIFEKFNYSEKHKIRQIIHSFWFRRELPTLDKILRAINYDDSVPNISRSNLHRILKKMDFVYIKKKVCSVLTERKELIIWRRTYLQDLQDCRRQKRPIYYLGETYINTSDCSDVLWQDQFVKSKYDGLNKRLIVLHIASEKGFHKNGLHSFESKTNSKDFRNEISEDIFKRWFEKILPSLERNSIIVMDNAPYRSVRKEQIPNRRWQKSNMITWLQSKGETFDEPVIKAQLYKRVKEIRNKYKSYFIDSLATEVGHRVLRLPPHHHHALNPIELAWPMVKGYVKENNTTFNVKNVQQLLIQATSIERVTPDNWHDFIERVKEEENKIWEVDDIMDDVIDELEPCPTTGYTSSSTDTESDSDSIYK